MKTYVFTGIVYQPKYELVMNPDGITHHSVRDLIPHQSRVTIEAPTAAIAQEILNHYGMESVKREKTR
jgi:hypothetical protein